jgi:hypothetical protein
MSIRDGIESPLRRIADERGAGAVGLVQAPPNRVAWSSHPALTGWRGAI